MFILRIFYKGWEKFYKMVRKLAKFDVHKAEGQEIGERQSTGQQDVKDMQNPQLQAQLRQLKQKLTSLMDQIATTKQSNQSQTHTTQQLLQQQSTQITNLTQQLQQLQQQPPQTNQKTTQLYAQKLKQYDERLANISAQIPKLKVEHQSEVEKVMRDKNAVIEKLEQKVKELGEGRSEEGNKTLGEGYIVEDQGSGGDQESESEEEESEEMVQKKEIVKQKVNYESPSQNKQSNFFYGTFKVILFFLSVNVARIFCKVIQTQFSS